MIRASGLLFWATLYTILTQCFVQLYYSYTTSVCLLYAARR